MRHFDGRRFDVNGRIDRKKIKEASDINEDFMLKLLGGEISSARKKCAFLPLIALKKALKNLSN